MINDNMLPVGTLLHNGEYRIERQLGAGGFGNTYVVQNTAFGDLYAMKEFFMKGVNLREGNRVTVSVPDNHASFESQREKFKKEAQRLHKLKSPHVVHVLALFEENGTVYYVMNYIDGRSLSDTLKQRNQPMTEAEVSRMLPQMLEALDEVHQQGIWHLDIKPGNIMLDSHGKAYLIDFGASKQMRGADGMSLSTSSALCYTPGYAPIEQIEQDMTEFGPWTDFFALGATLYTLLSNQQPPSLSDIRRGKPLPYPQPVSQNMQNLIQWLMAFAHEDRPKSVQQIRQRMPQLAQPQQPEGQKEKAGVQKEEAGVQKTEVGVPTKLNENHRKKPVNNEQPQPIQQDGQQTHLASKEEGVRKRNDITTTFLWLFIICSIPAIIIGGIYGAERNCSAILSGTWTLETYSGDISCGFPIMLIGVSVLVGMTMLLKWKRTGFWLMVLIQLATNIPAIGGDYFFWWGYVGFSVVFDLLIFLIMLIPCRVVKGEPRRSAWSQCDSSTFAKWFALIAFTIWLLIVLFVPPIYAIACGIKSNFYITGRYLIACDLGNDGYAEDIAETYYGHSLYWGLDSYPFTEPDDRYRTLRYLEKAEECYRRSHYDSGVDRIRTYIDKIENPEKYNPDNQPSNW